jgi:hypothetical protein
MPVNQVGEKYCQIVQRLFLEESEASSSWLNIYTVFSPDPFWNKEGQSPIKEG